MDINEAEKIVKMIKEGLYYVSEDPDDSVITRIKYIPEENCFCYYTQDTIAGGLMDEVKFDEKKFMELLVKEYSFDEINVHIYKPQQKAGCEVCDKLGEKRRVDFLEGEQFPEETKRLETVPDTDGSVCRCPVCGQAYCFHSDYDNDVYNLYNYGEYYRITGNRVNEITESCREYSAEEAARRKKQLKYFKSKIRKKFSSSHEKLSGDEKHVFEYLVLKMEQGEYLKTIAADLSLNMDYLLAVTGSLEKNGFVLKRINYPLSPGEHNFQQEIRDVDPVPYTSISINLL